MKKLLVLALLATVAGLGVQCSSKEDSIGSDDPQFKAGIARLDSEIRAARDAGNSDGAVAIKKRRESAVQAMAAGERQKALSEIQEGIRTAGRAKADGGASAGRQAAGGGSEAVAAGGRGGGGEGGGMVGGLVGQQLQAVEIQQTIQNSQVTPQLQGVRTKARAAADAANRASAASSTTGQE